MGSTLLELFARNYFHPKRFFGIGDNIFFTIAVNITIIFLFEWRKKQQTKAKKILGIFLIILFTLLALLFSESTYIGVGIFYIFYLLRERPNVKYLAYTLYCLFFLIISFLQNTEVMYVFEYQWAMIFALPFIVLYNGQKGRDMKYLFYTFYPAHLWIFFILSSLFRLR